MIGWFPGTIIRINVIDTAFERGVEISVKGFEENALRTLSIPEPYRAGVAKVGKLTPASFSELLEALRNSPSAETAKDLAAVIEKDVPTLDNGDVEVIILSLASMQRVQKSAHVDPVRFSSDVWDSLSEDAPELIEGIEEETLKGRVAMLISETHVHLTSVKVSELRSEVERRFCTARILTDLRAAFPDDPKQRPAMTVLHTLEIKYHDDMARHREFYVSLSDDDLVALKEAIERAGLKKQTLITLLKKADFEFFE